MLTNRRRVALLALWLPLLRSPDCRGQGCGYRATPLEVIRCAPVLVEGVVVSRGSSGALLRVGRVFRGHVAFALVQLPDIKRPFTNLAGTRLQINLRAVVGLRADLTLVGVEDSALGIVTGSKIVGIASNFVALTDTLPDNDAPALSSLDSIRQQFKRLVEPDQLILMDAIQLGHLPATKDQQREVIQTALASNSDAVHAGGLSLAYNLKLLDEFLDSFVDGLSHREPWVRQSAIACLRDVRATDDGFESRKASQEQRAVIDRWRAWAEERKNTIRTQSPVSPEHQAPAKE